MFVHTIHRLSAFSCLALLANVAVAGSVVLDSSCNGTNRADTDLVCSYTVTFRDLRPRSLLSVKLRIPKHVRLHRTSVLNCIGCAAKEFAVKFQPPVIRQDRLTDFRFFLDRDTGCFTFQLRAPRAEYQETKTLYYWSLNDRSRLSGNGEANVPSRRSKASVVRLMAGPGFTRHFDDFVEFKEIRDEDKHIFVENDSQFRAELITGGLIKIHEFRNGMTMDLALGVQFAEGGEAVDGAFMGFGFGILPHLELVVGLSRHRGKELAPGFENAMGQFVKRHRHDHRYPELWNIDIKDDKILDPSDYDGLPLSYVDNEGQEHRIFPGSPLTNSYNSKLSFGILLPLDVWKLFKPDNDE